MEGTRFGKQRDLVRVDEPHRLEEELWVAVYEQVCPLVRRRVKDRQSAPKAVPLEGALAGVNVARRA